MQRRDVLKSAAAAAGLTILKSGTLRGQNAPSNKLNIALFGVWGRGTAHYNVLRNENVVAICDVNDNRTKEALEIFPKAKTYWDWRRTMDQKDIAGRLRLWRRWVWPDANRIIRINCREVSNSVSQWRGHSSTTQR